MLLKVLGVLYLLGLVGMFVGWVWLRRRAFERSVWWGLACLFLPLGSLVFLIRHWDDARDPFIASTLGFACLLPLILAGPLRFAQNFTAGLHQGGVRGAFATAAFPPDPPRPARADPWPNEPAKSDSESETDAAPDAASAEATPAGPSVAFEREESIAQNTEQRRREAQSAYDQHRAEAETLFKDLNARRAKLKVDDTRAVAAFNAEAARYAALLERTKAERTALDLTPSTVAVTATTPTLAGPVPPQAAAKRGPEYVPGVVGGNPDGTKPVGKVSSPSESQPGLYRRSLDRARAARDAALRQRSEADQ